MGIYDEIIVDNEEWQDIKPEIINGVKGYKISDYGRLKNHKGQISVGYNQEGGYLCVSILSKQYKLHILVAKVFIPNSEKKKNQVNHIDGNKLNAKLTNLEWCTASENVQHAHDTGLNPSQKPIIQYDKKMNKIKEFKSIIEASTELKISTISSCCLGKQKTVGCFIFKFM